MADIPAGHGIIAGRSPEVAAAALAAAEAAGLPASVVRVVRTGYLVPDAVLEAYHGAPEDDGTPTSDWKNAEIETWASDHGVDLGGATKKADMLAAIAAANKEE